MKGPYYKNGTIIGLLTYVLPEVLPPYHDPDVDKDPYVVNEVGSGSLSEVILTAGLNMLSFFTCRIRTTVLERRGVL